MSTTRGGLTETWTMVRAKRARTAETPKQTSWNLRLRASYFYPDLWISGLNRLSRHTAEGRRICAGTRTTLCATRRVICTVCKHLLPAVGRQAYPPNLRAEQPTGQG